MLSGAFSFQAGLAHRLIRTGGDIDRHAGYIAAPTTAFCPLAARYRGEAVLTDNLLCPMTVGHRTCGDTVQLTGLRYQRNFPKQQQYSLPLRDLKAIRVGGK